MSGISERGIDRPILEKITQESYDKGYNAAKVAQSYIDDDNFECGKQEGYLEAMEDAPSRFVWFLIGVVSTVIIAMLIIHWIGPVNGTF